MSKSSSSTEKPKSARIPTAEPESQVPVKNRRGLRVKKSFSFQRGEPDHTVDIIRANINFQKEAERLCKIESEKRVQTEVKVMLCTGNGEVKLRTPSDQIMKSLIKDAVLRK